MTKTHKYYVWIIVVSAILTTVLFNWRNYSQLIGYFQESGNQALHPGEYPRVYFLVINTLGHFILFNLFAFFNYFWKDKFIKPHVAKPARVALIVAGNVALYILFALLEHAINHYLTQHLTSRLRLRQTPYASYFLFTNYVVALLAIAETYFLILQQKVKTAEVVQLQLQEEKKHAELEALKEQISPHFFFNTLSSLSTIVRNEAKEAGLEFIQDMSRVYRYALSNGGQDLVELQAELDFIDSYIALIQKRFGKKMIYQTENLASVKTAKIPPMALQLLIENAIQHNIITQASPLVVRIYAQTGLLCVANNLQPKETSGSFGIGLQNLANRYRLLVNKEIVIEKDKTHFCVKLPLL